MADLGTVSIMSECVHHWDIDSLNHGICRKCGTMKQFPTLAEINLARVGNKPSSFNRGNAQPLESSEVPGRKRGRPAGSKNKPKIPAEVQIEQKPVPDPEPSPPPAEVPEVEKETRPPGKCKNCGSVNSVKYGIRNGRQKYQCLDCKKVFTDFNADYGMHTPKDIVDHALLMFDEGKYSQRQIIDEMTVKYGFKPSTATVCHWLDKYRPGRTRRTRGPMTMGVLLATAITSSLDKFKSVLEEEHDTDVHVEDIFMEAQVELWIDLPEIIGEWISKVGKLSASHRGCIKALEGVKSFLERIEALKPPSLD